jgi:hypothetical protein
MKIKILVCVLMLVCVGLLSGCIGTGYRNGSKAGIIIDVQNIGDETTILYKDDSMTSYYTGDRSSLDLYLFCKNHKNESITIEYKVTDTGNTAGRFLVNDFYLS